MPIAIRSLEFSKHLRATGRLRKVCSQVSPDSAGLNLFGVKGYWNSDAANEDGSNKSFTSLSNLDLAAGSLQRLY